MTLPPTDIAAGMEQPAQESLWRAEIIDTLRLSWPMALTQLGQIAMMTTDLMLLGRLGDQVVAATALAHTVLFAASVLASAAPTHAEQIASVWKLEKAIAAGASRYHAESWTRPMLTMSEQLSLVLLLELALGVIFEMPLVMALLAVVGLVKSRWLFKYQRHAIIICLIAAAIITPTGDAINLSLMAGPMILCYEVGVLAVWLVERRRTRMQAAEGEGGAITPG